MFFTCFPGGRGGGRAAWLELRLELHGLPIACKNYGFGQNGARNCYKNNGFEVAGMLNPCKNNGSE